MVGLYPKAFPATSNSMNFFLSPILLPIKNSSASAICNYYGAELSLGFKSPITAFKFLISSLTFMGWSYILTENSWELYDEISGFVMMTWESMFSDSYTSDNSLIFNWTNW